MKHEKVKYCGHEFAIAAITAFSILLTRKRKKGSEQKLAIEIPRDENGRLRTPVHEDRIFQLEPA